MRIYIFVDYYPNPYKPYFDSQFVALIKQGHNISIFSADSYMSTVNSSVENYKLIEKTKNFPRVLSDIPKFIPKIFYSAMNGLFSSTFTNLSVFNAGHSLKENILNTCRAFLIDLEAPDICLIHNLDIASIFTFLKDKYPKSKVAMYYHGGEVGRTPTIRNDEYSFSAVDKIFTNTVFSKKQAIRRGAEERKISIIPVGFNLNYYPDIRDKIYKPDGILRLISVGRLSEEKGLFIALDAMKIISEQGIDNWEYKIIGNGYIADKLKKRVDEFNLCGHVKFLGEKNTEEVSQELSLADVLILPSLETWRWSETQACVVQEAMLMKCIVITTTTGGVPESIYEGMRQFSVEQGNSTDIAEKIENIISMPEYRMKKLGEEGRNFVVNNYEIKDITSRMIASIIDT